MTKKVVLFEIYEDKNTLAWMLRKNDVNTALKVVELLRVVIDVLHDDLSDRFGPGGKFTGDKQGKSYIG